MRFSVVIPVHNAGKTIRRCVDSLFANTFRDMEVIAVEDGSKDDSWAVLEELAKKYPRLTILKNAENKGVSYRQRRLGGTGLSGTFFRDLERLSESLPGLRLREQ